MIKNLKKLKKIQIARHLVQLISFFLLPGFYSLALSEFRNIYEMILNGNFDFMQMLVVSMEFITVIIITIVLGRFFCGWVCAFGTYNDFIYAISKNIVKHKFKISEKADNALKYLKYIILLFLVAFVWPVGSEILKGTSPWDAFGQITNFKEILANIKIGFILLALITVGAFFIERFFCRYLCPLGAIFSIFSKLSIFKMKMPKDKCVSCKACTSKCSMGIPLYKVNQARGGECINCFNCTSICPTKNAVPNIFNKNINTTFAISIALCTVVLTYVATSTGVLDILQNSITTSSSITTNTEDNSIKATIEPKIEQTTNISTPEVQKATPSAIQTISPTPIQTQSPSTKPSPTTKTDNNNNNNIKPVTEPKNEETNIYTPNVQSPSPTKIPTISPTIKPTISPAKKYKDGIYTGQAIGYRGGITKVSVTVKDDKITNIQTISNEDTPRYFDMVENTIISKIKSVQSTSVDTVSGATYSSKGIINAVENALSLAKY